MLTTYHPLNTRSVKATAAIQARTFVGFDGAPCAAGARAIGVALTDAVAGDDDAVVDAGTVPVIAGAAITAGSAIAVGADAYAVVADRAAVVCGVAYTAAAEAGDTIEYKHI